VTLEEFSAFMEWAVDWWNDRPSDVLGGLSPKQAYARGLGLRAKGDLEIPDARHELAMRPRAQRFPNDRAELRLNKAMFQPRSPDARNRLLARRKQGAWVHFDPDDIDATAIVTDAKGRVICEAPVIKRSPFLSEQHAKDHARMKRDSKRRRALAVKNRTAAAAHLLGPSSRAIAAAKTDTSAISAEAGTVVEGAFEAPAAKPRTLRETAAMDEAALNAPRHRRRAG